MSTHLIGWYIITSNLASIFFIPTGHVNWLSQQVLFCSTGAVICLGEPAVRGSNCESCWSQQNIDAGVVDLGEIFSNEPPYLHGLLEVLVVVPECHSMQFDDSMSVWINELTERLKWHLMLWPMQESTSIHVHQTWHVRIASETQKIQFSDYVTSCLM